MPRKEISTLIDQLLYQISISIDKEEIIIIDFLNSVNLNYFFTKFYQNMYLNYNQDTIDKYIYLVNISPSFEEQRIKLLSKYAIDIDIIFKNNKTYINMFNEMEYKLKNLLPQDILIRRHNIEFTNIKIFDIKPFIDPEIEAVWILERKDNAEYVYYIKLFFRKDQDNQIYFFKNNQEEFIVLNKEALLCEISNTF